MTVADFARIEALFHAALERAPDERERYLAGVEADAAVREQVWRLLARDAEEGRMSLQPSAAAALAPLPRQRIGPCRLLSEIGAGGMGTVFLAERDVGGAVQRVALKLIRGFPTRDARARFARERRLLAGLNHPGIARLLDGGDSEDGQPYLVMELVEGLPLATWNARPGRSDTDRLRLFARLCRAVQHAHQRLIVHRDIKPANILVREDDAPVLLDFGIGRWLGDEGSQAGGTRAFTPDYAAPEQRAGHAPTTATDVYALGCVLHELVSGRRFADARAGERCAPGRELARVIAMATREQPAARYPSAQAFADDIDNYLAHRPLRAAPDRTGYRMRRFIGRHRGAVAVAALACALSAAFGGRLALERRRTIDAEARAAHDARDAHRANDVLVGLFDAVSPQHGGGSSGLRALVDRGRNRLHQDFNDDAQAAAPLGAVLARVYADLGDPETAAREGERALALLGAPTPDTARLRADLLRTLAGVYDDTERFDEARRADAQALDLRSRYRPEDREGIADALAGSGDAAMRAGDDPSARDFLARAEAEYARLPQADPVLVANVMRDTSDLDAMAGRFDEARVEAEHGLQRLVGLPPTSTARLGLWRVLAQAQLGSGDPAASQRTLEHAIDVARAALGEVSDPVSVAENDLAVALNAQGRYREAIAHLEQANAITRKLRPDAPTATAYTTVNLGVIHENLGDYAQAERLMREGIDAIAAAAPSEPQLDGFRVGLARTLMLRGQVAAARTLADAALAAVAARDGEGSYAYAVQALKRVRIDLAANEGAAAAHTLAAASGVLDPLLPARHRLRPQIDLLRGLVAAHDGNATLAARVLHAAVATQAALRGGDPIVLAGMRAHLAGALLDQGKIRDARRELDAAQPVLDAELLPDAVDRRDAQACRVRLARLAAVEHRSAAIAVTTP